MNVPNVTRKDYQVRCTCWSSWCNLGALRGMQHSYWILDIVSVETSWYWKTVIFLANIRWHLFTPPVHPFPMLWVLFNPIPVKKCDVRKEMLSHLLNGCVTCQSWAVSSVAVKGYTGFKLVEQVLTWPTSSLFFPDWRPLGTETLKAQENDGLYISRKAGLAFWVSFVQLNFCSCHYLIVFPYPKILASNIFP